MENNDKSRRDFLVTGFLAALQLPVVLPKKILLMVMQVMM